MHLAIFDLDNTLIGGDSDHAWGEFLVERRHVDGERYRALNDNFYRDYQRGELDIFAYLEFALEPLAQLSRGQLNNLQREFMEEVVSEIWLPQAEDLISRHRRRGHHIMIITATNRFVVEPIAERLGVDTLLATEPEEVEGRFTGRVVGEPCYQGGKVVRLHQWLAHNPGFSAAEKWFYSDSINDLPLLQEVDHPVAVDPDARLSAEAERRGWPIISLRSGG
ncbi:histidinol-phosphatase [Microbulbifer thermotolerans]|uniref:Histidinol-phosphatase n=1 Tax=Microbulbifer thermotolerans TaxID=252514 RepID=A0A143HP93_MICTH|nr:HAD family hydrolase [Microbulbifer thermotolerans]AMX03554.1 phosphoserine phosphatase [Microbulbifer thermotolerans]MCX2778178.1 HAD-IB family hydrolase [Microbulbifer thermotolerans]MCX2782188.1 HAD-IB family hydrolase [Microbulbifer thermotolerans]MCX2795280.1 HAD-IB family hydrolase [Microbulbifer thermotolerans]MCX2804526.1 HAD-IB family hydrolase [Microbulbifer thermotolerans]